MKKQSAGQIHAEIAKSAMTEVISFGDKFKNGNDKILDSSFPAPKLTTPSGHFSFEKNEDKK